MSRPTTSIDCVPTSPAGSRTWSNSCLKHPTSQPARRRAVRMRLGQESVGYQQMSEINRLDGSPARCRVLPQLKRGGRALPDQSFQRRGGLELIAPHGALPDHEDAPARSCQLLHDLAISSLIGTEFGQPELSPRIWDAEGTTTRVPMPKAAMNKDHRPPLRKHDVRPSGHVACMQTKPETRAPEQAAKSAFWLRVFAPDPGHHSGSCRAIHNIRHGLGSSAASVVQL